MRCLSSPSSSGWFRSGLVAPLIGGGFLGLGLIGGWTNTLVSQLIPDIAFALTFIILLRRSYLRPASATTQEQAALTRRRLLRLTGLGALVIAGGALAWDFISGGAANLFGGGNPSQPPLKLGTVPKISRYLFPTMARGRSTRGRRQKLPARRTFTTSRRISPAIPQIDAGSWQLQIGGFVKSPYSLTYDQLRALPQVQQYHTLECISNVVGGDLISNALFVGASLADILQKAGIQNGASELIFRPPTAIVTPST